MAQAIELIEFLSGKLYFISSCCGGAGSEPQPHASSDLVHFINVASEFPYAGFYLDFGPLSLGHVFAFAHKLDAKLEHLQQTCNRDARVCVHSSAHSNAKQHQQHQLELQHVQHRANAVCMLGCWAILSLGWSAERAFAPFKHLELPCFHDATRGSDSFGLSVLHVLRGLEKALQAQLVSPVSFSTEEYFHYEQPENGDLSWISPQFCAFAGPHDSYSKSAAMGTVKLAPEHYIEYFQKRNVTLVIRLSRKRYDKMRFTNAGLEFLDLYFPDGSCPSEAVLHKFLHVCEANEKKSSQSGGGAIAVHCKAGLGRTGTLIACYLMKTHRFTAEEAIGWVRLCRPGSVVGSQQHYVRAKQQQMWDLSPLAKAKELESLPSTGSSGEVDGGQLQGQGQQMSSPKKEGIAARPRRRSSLSGAAILKKVDQLRSSSTFGGCGAGANSSSGAKKSHSVSPATVKIGSVVNNGASEKNGPSSTPPTASSPSKALLPPRIPGKPEVLLTAADTASPTQGDLLVLRKQEQRKEHHQQKQRRHPAFMSAHSMGLWPFEPRVII